MSPITARATTTDPTLPTDRFIATINAVSPHHLQRMRSLLGRLPSSIGRTLRSPATTTSVIFTLVIQAPPATRTRRIRVLTGACNPRHGRRIKRCCGRLHHLSTRRIPLLVRTIIPTLGKLSPRTATAILRAIGSLTRPDNGPVLTTCTVRLVLRGHLTSEPTGTAPVADLSPL